MAEAAGSGLERFHGQPCHRLQLAHGDSLTVLLQGAQVISWICDGRERLYLSPASRWDGQTAVRGGVPVCFPQFNQRGPAPGLPKHGFARNLPWQAAAPVRDGEAAVLTLRLASSPATQAFLPAEFAAALQLRLSPGQLRIHLQVHNTGQTPWAFTGALHTYLAVDDVRGATLHGLGGQPEWDAVADVHGIAAEPLRLAGEFDRVYAAAPHPLQLQDGPHILRIEQSGRFANTVVWNPGAALCAGLADMPAEGWQHMLCVEAAQVFAPITVAAGGTWDGWQTLTQA